MARAVTFSSMWRQPDTSLRVALLALWVARAPAEFPMGMFSLASTLVLADEGEVKMCLNTCKVDRAVSIHRSRSFIVLASTLTNSPLFKYPSSTS
jgi:hypothetical protein